MAGMPGPQPPPDAPLLPGLTRGLALVHLLGGVSVQSRYDAPPEVTRA